MEYPVTRKDDCPTELPTADIYLSNLSAGYLAGVTICALLTLAVFCLYLEQVVFFFRHLGQWKPKDKALWLITVYPVFALTSLVAVMVPRSSAINNLVSSVYLSICVYLFVTMLIGHYGGAKQMSVRLANVNIPVREAPCCWCICFPDPMPVTSSRLRILETVVLQYAVLNPIFCYTAAILAVEDKLSSGDLAVTSSYMWLSLINLVSTLLALYGFILVYRVSRHTLQRTTVKPKFIVLQLVLIICNIQHLIFSIFVRTGVIPCDDLLSAKANGERWHHMFVILEMSMLCVAARHYYRRHVGELPPEEMMSDDVIPTMTSSGSSRHPSRRYDKERGFDNINYNEGAEPETGTTSAHPMAVNVTSTSEVTLNVPPISNAVPDSTSQEKSLEGDTTENGDLGQWQGGPNFQ